MVDEDAPDPQFDAMTARLLRREALRRAMQKLNTTSAPGLEAALARISAEVTADAAEARGPPTTGPGHPTAARIRTNAAWRTIQGRSPAGTVRVDMNARDAI
jgi:hypothetical protein